jgi:hypothetical protein
MQPTRNMLSENNRAQSVEFVKCHVAPVNERTS